MSEPITWRTLFGPSQDAVVKQQALGINTLNSAFDQANKTFDTYRDARDSAVVNNILDRIQGAKTIEELNALRADPTLMAGAENLQGKNRALLRPAIDAREQGLYKMFEDRRVEDNRQMAYANQEGVNALTIAQLSGDPEAIKAAQAKVDPRLQGLGKVFSDNAVTHSNILTQDTNRTVAQGNLEVSRDNLKINRDQLAEQKRTNNLNALGKIEGDIADAYKTATTNNAESYATIAGQKALTDGVSSVVGKDNAPQVLRMFSTAISGDKDLAHVPVSVLLHVANQIGDNTDWWNRMDQKEVALKIKEGLKSASPELLRGEMQRAQAAARVASLNAVRGQLMSELFPNMQTAPTPAATDQPAQTAAVTSTSPGGTAPAATEATKPDPVAKQTVQAPSTDEMELLRIERSEIANGYRKSLSTQAAAIENRAAKSEQEQVQQNRSNFWNALQLTGAGMVDAALLLPKGAAQIIDRPVGWLEKLGVPGAKSEGSDSPIYDPMATIHAVQRRQQGTDSPESLTKAREAVVARLNEAKKQK